MAQVLIRNIPDALIRTYKAKARLNGKSLEQELRDLMERHAPYTPEERVAISKKYHAEFPEPLPSLTKDEIREGLL